MKTSKNKIAKILALAFFESEGGVKTQEKHLLSLQKIVLLGDQIPRLSSFLVSPLFSVEEKEIFLSLLKTPKSVMLFLRIIVEKKMISHLKTITDYYESFLWAALGKAKTKVVVAHQDNISKSLEKLIVAQLEEIIDRKACLTFEVDPSLIGGFQLETESFYIDASLKKTLEEMRNSL